MRNERDLERNWSDCRRRTGEGRQGAQKRYIRKGPRKSEGPTREKPGRRRRSKRIRMRP